MRTAGVKKMGRFSIEFEVANYVDLVNSRAGTLKTNQVRRLRVRGVVDSGAMRLVLPQSVVKRLGIPNTGKVKCRYADGRRGIRDTIEGVYVEIMGRHGTFSAVVEPGRRTALIGAIVLEDLDYLVDCTHQRLVPRDPRIAISEIE